MDNFLSLSLCPSPPCFSQNFLYAFVWVTVFVSAYMTMCQRACYAISVCFFLYIPLSISLSLSLSLLLSSSSTSLPWTLWHHSPTSHYPLWEASFDIVLKSKSSNSSVFKSLWAIKHIKEKYDFHLINVRATPTPPSSSVTFSSDT